MTALIGLWGYAGAGKDAAAAALIADGWARGAFADKIREALYALNPVVDADGCCRVAPLVDAWGWDHVKRSDPEVRELLQRLGTEAGRQVLGPDVWVDALFRDWNAQGRPPCVVTDMRFPNEAEAIRAAGGLTVAILRPGVEAVNGHASETALADWPFDFVVHNDRDLEHLHEVIRAIAALPRHDAPLSVSQVLEAPVIRNPVPTVNRVEESS